MSAKQQLFLFVATLLTGSRVFQYASKQYMWSAWSPEEKWTKNMKIESVCEVSQIADIFTGTHMLSFKHGGSVSGFSQKCGSSQQQYR